MGGFAASRVLEVHGERMVKRTFEPGFRIELHQKDLNLALNSARQLGLSLPNTASAEPPPQIRQITRSSPVKPCTRSSMRRPASTPPWSRTGWAASAISMRPYGTA